MNIKCKRRFAKILPKRFTVHFDWTKSSSGPADSFNFKKITHLPKEVTCSRCLDIMRNDSVNMWDYF